jgi:5-methylcytosine-specific restriction endonuclease McrA
MTPPLLPSEKLYRVSRNMNARARKKYHQIGVIYVDDLVKIIKTQNGRCFYCGREVVGYDDNRYMPNALTFDHKRSMGLGGTNTVDNLVMCCLECNRKRNHIDLIKQRDFFS